jgi:hypothetical protein
MNRGGFFVTEVGHATPARHNAGRPSPR